MRAPTLAIAILFFLLALSNCQRKQSADGEALVRTSLRPIHSLQGDQGWRLEDRMAHYGVPGMSMAVVAEGRIEWVGHYGHVDKVSGTAVDEGTLFQAASISKPVTAYGVMQLAAEGKFSPDTAVNSLLSSWHLEENMHTADQPVTIKHLLSHTAGISVHGFRGYSTDEPLPTLHQILDSEDPANSWVIRPIQAVGESFRYSGGGYCVLQQVLIDQLGMPFEEIMRQRVLEPLNMLSSTFEQPPSDSVLALAASGYLPDGTMVQGRRHIYPEMAAAGLWTNALDLARFGLALQRGYAEQTVVQEMLTPFFDDVGLGIFLLERDSTWYFQHGGWNEGFSSEMIFARDLDYGAVVMTNANQPEFIAEVLRSVAEVYGWENYLSGRYLYLPLDATLVDQIEGRYKFSSDQVVSVFARNDSLFLQYLNESEEQLHRIAGDRFVRRTREYLVEFGPDSLGHMSLTFEHPDGNDRTDNFQQLADADRVPFEYLLAEQWQDARSAYLTLEQTNPQDADLNEYRIYQRVDRLMEQGRLRSALELLKIITELHPGSATAFHRLADAYLEMKDAENALRNYKKSVKFYPQNEEAKKMIEQLENPKVDI